MIEILKDLFIRIADSLPDLGLKLRQADMKDTPVDFVKKTVFTSFYMTTGLILFLVAVFSQAKFFILIFYMLTAVFGL